MNQLSMCAARHRTHRAMRTQGAVSFARCVSSIRRCSVRTESRSRLATSGEVSHTGSSVLGVLGMGAPSVRGDRHSKSLPMRVPLHRDLRARRGGLLRRR